MAMRAGNEEWVGSFPDDIDPRERQLSGRAVGIIGLGGIGRRLAELLKPFKVQLRVYDPYISKAVAARYGGELVPLMELLSESEIVVLAAAQSSETSRLVGKEEIAALQKNAVFVNISRASLVDMNALAARLKKGDLVAALDVFDQEPLPRNSPLRKLPNTYLTPHRAGGILESVVRALTMLADDFEAHLDGRRRRYGVTTKMLPCFAD
jgi:phosphoglycerate dehydrogenase-like enzyme